MCLDPANASFAGQRIIEFELRTLTMQVDLSGKVILVTGAARGIGEAIADRLAANGRPLIYADRDDATAAAAKSPGRRGHGDGRH